MIRLLKSGKPTSASATPFWLRPEMLAAVKANLASYRGRIVLRPQPAPSLDFLAVSAIFGSWRGR